VDIPRKQKLHTGVREIIPCPDTPATAND